MVFLKFYSRFDYILRIFIAITAVIISKDNGLKESNQLKTMVFIRKRIDGRDYYFFFIARNFNKFFGINL